MPLLKNSARLNSCLGLALGFALLEAMSLVVFFQPWLAPYAAGIIIILAAALTAYRTEFGAYLILAELTVGGLGHLLAGRIAGVSISLRMALFIGAMLAWSAKVLIKKDFGWLRDHRLWPLFFVSAVLLFSVGRGLESGYHPVAVFTDINGYLFLALAGLFLSARLKPTTAAKIIFVGSAVSGLITVAALFLFSHGFAQVGTGSDTYRWLRDTRVGEITLISAPLYRIFFQSHFYNLLALLLSAWLLLIGFHPAGVGSLRIKMNKPLLWLAAWFNFFILIISQSRSFWAAGLASLLAILPAFAAYFRVAWQRLGILLLLIPAFAWLSNFAGQTVIGDYGADFIAGRVSGASSQPAVSSRLAQLQPAYESILKAPWLGNGFGATVRYRSDDPRIKTADNPEGWIDASALEWGYLDLTVKAGVIGLLAYLIFLAYLAWPLILSTLKRDSQSAILLSGLLALLAVHMFTPYLNHPLGIGYILLVMALMKKPA